MPFTANGSDNSVSMFEVSPAGTLSLMRPSTVPAGAAPSGIVVVDRPTAGRDVLHGSSAAANVICGHGGHDVLHGHDGDDTLHGDTCGGSGATASALRRRSRGGRDRLFGGHGDDRLIGGPGADRLHGGPGRHVLRGAAGGDAIDARDGRRDIILCGDGRDMVRADRRDRTRGCEAPTGH